MRLVIKVGGTLLDHERSSVAIACELAEVARRHELIVVHGGGKQVTRFLEERGYEVETASNGADALQMLGCVRPHLIVTDLQMPRMTGSEFITALKSNPTTAQIPVIVIAGRTLKSDLQREQRADYVIFKDIDTETQLAKALDKIFSPVAR